MFGEAYCEYPFNRVRVTSEGYVGFCCFMRPDPRKGQGDNYIGNVLKNNFDEIWFGDIAESIRESVLQGELHNICGKCPGCPLLSKIKPYATNKFIYNEYPTFLEIDLPNTHCNVGGIKPDPIKSPACIMCERSSAVFKPEENHLFKVLANVKHIVHNLQTIHIQGIAEPFYQTRADGFLLFEVLDDLEFDSYSKKIQLSVTTNGTIFKQSIRREYLKRAPKSITAFSIDAATSETFKKIRIFDCYDNVIENIENFNRERNKQDQHLIIRNNINLLNVNEVVEMARVAKRVNANLIELNVTSGFLKEILVNESNCGLFYNAQKEFIAECKRLGQPYLLPKPLDLGLTNQLVQLTL